MYSFKAKIYKVGINPCVDVPEKIYSKLIATKGYIPVKGTINQFPFQQTLCPVKNGPYRLYVNIPMMKGADVVTGDTAKFSIEQDDKPKTQIEVPAFLTTALIKNKLMAAFEELTPSRQKEISKYLGYLKTEEAKKRNLEKLMSSLKQGKPMWGR